MTPETLHRLFDVVADAPGGVQRLRELILQLAVRGKLVPQDPNDEPASVLLDRIEEEKRRLYNEGKIRKLEKLPPVGPDEVPFDIPPNWVWSRLVDLGHVNPRNDLDDSALVSFCPMASIPERYGAPVEFEVRRWGEIKGGYTHFAENDVVIAKITPCFQNGKGAVMRGLVGGAGAGTTELYVFRPIPGALEPDYVLIFLKSPGFVSDGERRMTGTAGQQRLPREYFETTPIPVPPLAEQRRIVAKVAELMSICDELEERQRRRAEKRASLNRSALHHFTTATDDADLARHWRRIRDHFDVLYEVPETVAELRQAILQLAVRGKLVPQDPNDEPASVLLERIKEEKRRLYNEGKIRKLEKLPPVGPDEVPFEVPEGWVWVRMGQLITLISGQHLPPGEYHHNSDGIPYLTGPADFGKISPVATRWTHTRKAVAERGDILLTVKGAGIGKVNVLAYPEAAISRQLMAIRPIYVSRKFVLLLVRAAWDRLQEEKVGIAIPGISREDVLRLPIALPPLQQQHRIVAKVDRLMVLCDELEERLSNSRALAESIAAAVVNKLTAT